MITDHDRAMARLHSRVVRGEYLSADEQRCLDAWYAAQDATEGATLQVASIAPADLITLQQDIDVALARLEQATHDVQALVHQNDVLRQQISALEARLRARVLSAA